MMNLAFLSPETIACIARGSVSLEQKYYYHCHGWSHRYCVGVTYPNGWGASIVCSYPLDSGADIWEVALLKDGKLYEPDGMDCSWSDLTEKDVIDICNRIFFFGS